MIILNASRQFWKRVIWYFFSGIEGLMKMDCPIRCDCEERNWSYSLTRWFRYSNILTCTPCSSLKNFTSWCVRSSLIKFLSAGPPAVSDPLLTAFSRTGLAADWDLRAVIWPASSEICISCSVCVIWSLAMVLKHSKNSRNFFSYASDSFSRDL